MFVRLQGLEGRRRGSDVPEFLSTHPGTSERIQWLRREMEADRSATQ